MTLFSKKILTWFNQHGRKDLPWQHPITPYRVYISEIMLQQTQVTTVIPYFERFMKSFPDINTLSNAPLDHVLHLWTGLGYYARARNCHKTAKIISQNYQGEFPNNVTLLQSLPGIGRSTAGAICALAFDQREPILDGNVKRVLSRFHGIEGWPGIKIIEEKLWALSLEHLPKTHLRHYTQAMMDLGATLCTRTHPQCDRCPLNKDCIAFAIGNPAQYPGKKPKKILPVRKTTFIVLTNEKQQVLLQKRPELGIWGGLWSLPELSISKEKNPHKQLKGWCLQQGDYSIQKIKKLTPFRHTFSHFHLDITPIHILIKSKETLSIAENNQIWYHPEHSEPIGLPQPIYRILQTLLS